MHIISVANSQSCQSNLIGGSDKLGGKLFKIGFTSNVAAHIHNSFEQGVAVRHEKSPLEFFGEVRVTLFLRGGRLNRCSISLLILGNLSHEKEYKIAKLSSTYGSSTGIVEPFKSRNSKRIDSE